MDTTTLVGGAVLVISVVVAFATGAIPAVFLNAHGIVLVLGGTMAAMLLNTPWIYLKEAARALSLMGRAPGEEALDETVRAVLDLAAQVRQRGVAAFDAADPRVAGGFLAHASDTALQYGDADLIGQLLESEIDQEFDHHNEIVNVYRTMGVLSPMFGLLGTLIGIVDVLRQIANPDQVGRAMAVAVTTAFYGIGLANAFCIPVAGKLRIRYWQEMRAKRIIKEGVVLMLRGKVVSVIERRLRSLV